MDRKITEEMEIEIKEEIDKALSILRSGRNYRDYSEETIDILYPHIRNIIEDDLLAQDAEDEDVDRLVVNEDMVITAMMMELCGCV